MPKLPKPGRRPIITIAFGRQRVGKTALLNAMAQYYRERGCPVQVWNADQQNRSHSLSTFFQDAKTVPPGGLDDGKAWIEARFEELAHRMRCHPRRRRWSYQLCPSGRGGAAAGSDRGVRYAGGWHVRHRP